MGARIFEKSLDEITPRAFLMLKASPEREFTDLFKELAAFPGINMCNAVKGDQDIFLSLEMESLEQTVNFYEEELRQVNGIAASEMLLVSNPKSDTPSFVNGEILLSLDNPKEVYSYILIKAEECKIKTILETIVLNENVMHCSYLSGSFNIILLVSGSSYTSIDKFISKKLQNIDGILKIKEYPVINIYNL